MKKILSIILVLVISTMTICTSSNLVSASNKCDKVSLNELVSGYNLYLKAYNHSSISNNLFSKAFKKSNYNMLAQSKKIMAFYNRANEDGFTNLYHPNADLSINEKEILNDLPTDNSLCIFLFGNEMNEDGSMSNKFIARCKTAYALAMKYPNAYIMVTGGHTAGNKYPSEGETGKKWLIEHGINENRIIVDELAWDTFGNVLCSFALSDLMQHKEINSFVVVSSDYHVPRCSIILMTYIYTFGYDLPKEAGGKGYQYLGNLGAVLD